MYRSFPFSLVIGMLLAASARAQVPAYPLSPFPPPGCCRPEPVDPPAPMVRLSMRVPACALAGETLRYRIIVDNCSPAPAYQVLVRDTLPANAKLVSAEPRPDTVGTELIWNLGTLCGGCSKEITLVLAPLDRCDVKNCARVQFEYGQCVTTHISDAAGQPFPGVTPTPLPPGTTPPGTTPPETPKPHGPPEPPVRPVPDPKKDDQTPPPPPPPPPIMKAGLSLTISGPKEGAAGQPLQYSFTVANPGTATASELLVAASLEDFAYVRDSASEGGSFVADQVAWVLKTLPAGQSHTFTLKVRARSAGTHCISGEAAAKDSGSGQELQRANARFCTEFTGEAGLHLEIIDRNDPIEVGGATSYPIRVLNQGQVSVSNLRIRAFVPESMAMLRASGPTDYRALAERTADGRLILEFDPLGSLPAGEERLYEVFVQPRRDGNYLFRAQMSADQLTAGTVTEEESTTVFREDDQPAMPAPPPPPRQL